MTTMKDVARVAKVSLATVSSTLSGAAYASPELKERVHAAVKQLGYAPNSIASGLKRGTTTLIGLIVPDITNPFYTELIHVVQRRARQAGYSVLLCDSEQDVERELSLIRLMRAHLAAGTILCPTGPEQSYEGLAEDIGPMALVTVDHVVPDDRVDSVVLDNVSAATLATRHILQFGHQRIAAVVGPQHLVPARGRLQGFAETLQAANIPVDEAMTREAGFRQDSAFVAATELLALPSRPTAIFVANNQMLIGVMRAIADAGLSCPRDVSIAAVDDFPWAAAFTPSLTTVRQPVEAMAEAALTSLLERIGGQKAAARHLVMAPELVVRNSCAAPTGVPPTPAKPAPRQSPRIPTKLAAPLAG
jgi:LacI family transcriptional regulator